MNLLFIGGTRFVGRAMVGAALSRGHQVTLFHRGLTNADLFPESEHLLGDRDGDLRLLENRRWDAVIDVSGYVPRIVRKSAEKLRDHTDRYVFISSISVYAEPYYAGMDETAPLTELDDPTVEEVNAQTYAGLKTLCERVVNEYYGERALIIRPGFVVGPYDPTDRFTYWVARVARGGEILAPGDAGNPIQFIDAADLGEWTIRMVEAGASGPYTVTGPETPLTWGKVLLGIQRVSESEAAFHWLPDSFLHAHNVTSAELPLWIPESHLDIARASIARALNAGLTFRPLDDTIRDTLEWYIAEREVVGLKVGMKPEREAELIAAWQAMA